MVIERVLVKGHHGAIRSAKNSVNDRALDFVLKFHIWQIGSALFELRAGDT